jgi:predicted dehydrogenase
MWSRNLLSINAKVIGDEGEMKVTNFVMPSAFGKITVRLPGEKRVIKGGKGKTYDYQLAAFAEAVLRGGPNIEPPSESIANMRVIDAIYTAAGLKLRGQ